MGDRARQEFAFTDGSMLVVFEEWDPATDEEGGYDVDDPRIAGVLERAADEEHPLSKLIDYADGSLIRVNVYRVPKWQDGSKGLD